MMPRRGASGAHLTRLTSHVQACLAVLTTRILHRVGRRGSTRFFPPFCKPDGCLLQDARSQLQMRGKSQVASRVSASRSRAREKQERGDRLQEERIVGEWVLCCCFPSSRLMGNGWAGRSHTHSRSRRLPAAVFAAGYSLTKWLR